MVSRSRTSPIRMTSGAWRRVFLSAVCQFTVSTPTSRWVMRQPLCGWVNSIGSSMVMMWPWEFSLRYPTIAASVVDLPEPVAPTMITRPRLVMMMSFSTGGSPRSSIFGIVVVITRSTMPTFACWTKALTRNRPMPAGLMAKLHSLVASNSAACRSFMIERARSTVCVGVSAWLETGVILPSILIAGGKPTVMKRSEALLDSISRSRSYMNFMACSRSIFAFLTGSPGEPSTPASLSQPAPRCPGRATSAWEIVLVRGLAPSLGRGNDVAPHQVLQVLVEGLHAEGLAGLDRRVHLRDLVLADEVADRGGADHDLVRGDPAGAVLGLAQRLGDDRANRLGDHRADHLLLRRRKHVDDAVDGFRRGARMQRAEHEVSGFGAGQREADGLEIAHFAHEDHVRVLAQGAAQGIGERQRVRSDLALVDQALFRLVHEFDRVLDGEDVALLVFVELVDHGGERRGLARARGPGHQDDAARLIDDLGEDLGCPEFFERQDLRGDRAHHRRRPAVLHEGVDAKARKARYREGEIALEIFLVVLPLPVVHDVVDHPVHVLVLHRRQVDAADVAVHADHRGQSRGQVQVGGLVLDDEG